jgi:hypothetical protein
MSVTIESDLKEYLTLFWDSRQKSVINRELTSLKDDIKDIKASQRNQIWALIGILGTALVGTVIRYLITAAPPYSP